MSRRLALSATLLTLACALAAPVHADIAPVGPFEVRSEVEAAGTQPTSALAATAAHRAEAPGGFGAQASALFPSYTWPLQHTLHDGYIMVNYIDHDPSTALLDYTGRQWTYDGHNGTDISMYNFREMDRGDRIFAAAPGTVFYTTWNKFDRNIGVNITDTENNVLVDNGDGTTTWYLHLRRNSLTVQAGDVVARGSMLGLVGSSGFSSDAHLHFECGQYVGAGWVPRDPWNGTSNAQPSLWQTQLPYVGVQHLWLADLYVTTQTAAGGDLNNIPAQLWKERMATPAVMGANEPYIPVILQLQGIAGDSYRLEILRPDASLYSAVNYGITGDFRYGWHYWYWPWSGNVSPAQYGTWAVRVLINNVEVKRSTFTVGASTVYAPRFTPVDGRSYRLSGSVQRDTVHVSALGGPVAYALVNAPAGVSLTDSILTIPGTSSQPSRSSWFQVIATDAAARRDTAWFHMVDLSKPQEHPLAVGPPSTLANPLAFAAPRPNPLVTQTQLAFELSAGSRVTLAIFDIGGRRVRMLWSGDAEAGSHAVTWNTLGDDGHRVRPGVYLARLATAGQEVTRRLVVIE